MMERTLPRHFRRNGRRRWFAGLTGWMGLFLLVSLVPARAGAPSQEGRWLLAIETSADMAPRRAALEAALEQLVRSGFDGRLRPGDTIGVWTFHHTVTTGQFPLQTWRTEAAADILRLLRTFLASRSWEHRGEPSVVVPLAEAVSATSERFNLIILCTGERGVVGTPFDAGINEAMERMRRVQRRARQPVVVVLRAEGGRWLSWAVGQPPWPVTMPETPGDRLAAGVVGSGSSAGLSDREVGRQTAPVENQGRDQSPRQGIEGGPVEPAAGVAAISGAAHAQATGTVEGSAARGQPAPSVAMPEPTTGSPGLEQVRRSEGGEKALEPLVSLVAPTAEGAGATVKSAAAPVQEGRGGVPEGQLRSETSAAGRGSEGRGSGQVGIAPGQVEVPTSDGVSMRGSGAPAGSVGAEENGPGPLQGTRVTAVARSGAARAGGETASVEKTASAEERAVGGRAEQRSVPAGDPAAEAVDRFRVERSEPAGARRGADGSETGGSAVAATTQTGAASVSLAEGQPGQIRGGRGGLFLWSGVFCLAGAGVLLWVYRRGRIPRRGSLITESLDRQPPPGPTGSGL